MYNIKNYLCLSLVFTALLGVNIDAAVVRRAAFDFGSGKAKIQVADVDTESHHVLNTVYSDNFAILLSEDLARNENMFSQKIQDQTIAGTRKLKAKAIELGATEFCGIATEAFRNARNGQELINRLIEEVQIPSSIILQEDEGKLGFATVVEENRLNPSEIVCWDIGGGSFQITYEDDHGNKHVYKAPFGRLTMKHAIINHVQHKNAAEVSSPNPVSYDDWNATLEYLAVTLPTPEEALLMKLKQSDVQLYGIGAHPPALRAKGSYNADEVLQLIPERLNKTDEQLVNQHPAPPVAVAELAIAYGVMQLIDKDTVKYCTTNGGCPGLLVSEEYWK